MDDMHSLLKGVKLRWHRLKRMSLYV
jgi:hypothetical protein